MKYKKEKTILIAKKPRAIGFSESILKPEIEWLKTLNFKTK